MSGDTVYKPLAQFRDAIELRGTLERLAAERGADPEKLDMLKACVAAIDALMSAPEIDAELFSAYIALNADFHALLVELAQSPAVSRHIDRAASLPFASPSAFLGAQAVLPEARLVLTIAQDHHRSVVEAIELRQGSRAESLMREHARLAHRNLQFVLRDRETLKSIPGGAMLERLGV